MLFWGPSLSISQNLQTDQQHGAIAGCLAFQNSTCRHLIEQLPPTHATWQQPRLVCSPLSGQEMIELCMFMLNQSPREAESSLEVECAYQANIKTPALLGCAMQPALSPALGRSKRTRGCSKKRPGFSRWLRKR